LVYHQYVAMSATDMQDVYHFLNGK